MQKQGSELTLRKVGVKFYNFYLITEEYLVCLYWCAVFKRSPCTSRENFTCCGGNIGSLRTTQSGWRHVSAISEKANKLLFAIHREMCKFFKNTFFNQFPGAKVSIAGIRLSKASFFEWSDTTGEKQYLSLPRQQLYVCQQRSKLF